MTRYLLIALLTLVLLPIPSSADPTPSSAAAPAFFEFLDRMESHFERHPALKEQRGTGWNPYNRIKWLETPILADGAPPTADERRSLLEEKRRRSAMSRSSSSWFELGPVNLSGRILDIEFDPMDTSIVYVGTASGGLWKSTDSGSTWTPIGDDLPSLGIGGVAVSPNDSNIVLIGTGEGTPNFGRVAGVGVLKSTDAGSTWNPTGLTYSVTAGAGFHFLEVNASTGVYLGGTDNGLFRSTDEGDTWTEVGGGGQCWDAVWGWQPGSTRVYSIGGGEWWGGNEVRVSTDDGLTWSPSSTGLPSSGQIGKSKLALVRSEPGPTTLYAHLTDTGSYGTLGIYRSTNEGATWQLRSTANIAGGQGWYNATIAADPNQWNTVIAGGVELWRSTDGASSFVEVGDGYGLGTDTAVHWDHHAMRYVPGSTSTLWCGSDGGVWRSTDDGVNWQSRREGINTYQFYDICVSQSDPAWLMGGSQDNGVNGPVLDQDWFTSNLFADGMVCNVDPTDPTTVYAEWQFGNQVKSTDSGGSWFDIQTGMSANGGNWVTPVALDRNDPTTLFASLDSRIYRTTNGGASWANRTSFAAIWIDVNPADGNYVWAVNGNTVRRSSDGGDTWANAAAFGFPVGSETRIASDPGNVAGAFVTFASFNAGPALIARTTDLGATWSNVTGDLPAQPVNAMVVDPSFPDEWYIGTDLGVWQSTNGGVNWTPFDVALPNVVIWDLEIRDSARKLVAGTYGRGAWETDITPFATDVRVAQTSPARNLMLDPPLPNPVRRFTRLRFAARHDGPVTLSVYDVQGRLISPVATLPRGDGLVREASWDVTDAAAGVYFAVLQAGEERQSRKIVVTK